jgi:hypothetical protein
MPSHRSYASDVEKRLVKTPHLDIIFSLLTEPRKAPHPETEFLETPEDVREMQTQVPTLEIEARASASLGTAP